MFVASSRFFLFFYFLVRFFRSLFLERREVTIVSDISLAIKKRQEYLNFVEFTYGGCERTRAGPGVTQEGGGVVRRRQGWALL
ncbi:hypothetical protein D6783_01715 [Candidatus Woesearchaeota archaeon]|nr:MAG: hypothetical protein D6783_01715 [Candidatus Woesearchaeota archaeon]